MVFSGSNIVRWKETIDRYFITEYGTGDVNSDLFLEFHKTLAEIIIEVARKVAPKECWELHFMGANPLVKSEKYEVGFHFSTYLDSWFRLEAPIHYPQHIFRMSDDFWRLFLELHEYGKLEYTENIVPLVKPRIRSQSKKLPR